MFSLSSFGRFACNLLIWLMWWPAGVNRGWRAPLARDSAKEHRDALWASCGVYRTGGVVVLWRRWCRSGRRHPERPDGCFCDCCVCWYFAGYFCELLKSDYFVQMSVGDLRGVSGCGGIADQCPLARDLRGPSSGVLLGLPRGTSGVPPWSFAWHRRSELGWQPKFLYRRFF